MGVDGTLETPWLVAGCLFAVALVVLVAAGFVKNRSGRKR